MRVCVDAKPTGITNTEEAEGPGRDSRPEMGPRLWGCCRIPFHQDMMGDMFTKRIILFGGKGGVGKTTCAAASAVHFSRRGERTLVISTDPTPSLADIFERGGNAEGPLAVGENLWLWELGMEEIKGMWQRKFGPEVYEVFSAFVDIDYEEFTRFITSVIPGLAEEFMVDHIRELCRMGSYDRILWDTAPMGQTLGLLRTPSMLREHLRPAPRIYSRLRLGERTRRPLLEILRQWEMLSQQDILFLQKEVEICIVLIPEGLAVRQLERVERELEHYGLGIQRLILNGVVPKEGSEFLHEKARQQRLYGGFLKEKYPHIPMNEVPWFPYEIKGLKCLSEVAQALFHEQGREDRER